MDVRGPILVVEDDAEARTAIADVLRDEGYEVLEAADGRTALQVATRTSLRLVLLDLILPDTPGFELLEKLRVLPGGDLLQIVAVSGFPERAAEAIAENERLNGYLRKPFGAPELLRVVKTALAAPGSTPAAR